MGNANVFLSVPLTAVDPMAVEVSAGTARAKINALMAHVSASRRVLVKIVAMTAAVVCAEPAPVMTPATQVAVSAKNSVMVSRADRTVVEGNVASAKVPIPV